MRWTSPTDLAFPAIFTFSPCLAILRTLLRSTILCALKAISTASSVFPSRMSSPPSNVRAEAFDFGSQGCSDHGGEGYRFSHYTGSAEAVAEGGSGWNQER